ncbi:hypothetical protein [Haladaptatus halobius]|nr:hypothetical protein [Haladaptatus halobius]
MDAVVGTRLHSSPAVLAIFGPPVFVDRAVSDAVLAPPRTKS